MAVSLEDRLARELERLREQSRLRSLSSPRGIDFTSNDYLGLARNGELRALVIEYLKDGAPLSSSGSRLLRGNHPAHEALETQCATFFGTEAALYFNSGYDANLALLTTLPTRHDTIMLDSLVHASIKEGAHASLAAKRVFDHNSLDSLRSIRIEAAGNVYVVIESIYSMDGDEAPLREIADFCSEREYILIVDEAHATGVFGRHGRGLIDELGIRSGVAISMHTMGKALAAAGAIVACSQTVKDYLVNKARPLIYTTALPPAVAFQAMTSVDLMDHMDHERRRLFQNISIVRDGLTSLRRWYVVEGRSPIIAVVIGAEHEALRAAEHIRSAGLDIRAIRPPTVPENSSRLRIAIHADHSQTELDRLVNTLYEAEATCAE
ncbi:MAG: 8-amino-7-oxononanoate synthase [Bacteroidota bacterium]|nr:8-amino-7-oxononanoate synthase [Bacteroidota bacterium]MDP4232309.1 8-amino-7-oxononanoate synthase [Bacteroidota bacterium]MDP4241448.1 8-amino-7-oxononanoate synthase [Bacteroidota bacterium]MDP4286728.1 8-amino-7-oxononanoate synthase [Bacteroidota bacterium]